MAEQCPIIEKFARLSTGCPYKSAEKHFWCYPTTDAQVYYHLQEENGFYQLSFWVDTYAKNRNELQKVLEEEYHKSQNEVKRHFRLGSYYSARGLIGYSPIFESKNLEEDLDFLEKIVSRVIVNTQKCCLQDGNIPVGICSETVDKILSWPLSVPDYQRGYCWKRQNILGMLNDIEKWQGNHNKENDMYHIGTIVLKETDDNHYDIIDGQQRLITLALCAVAKKYVDIEQVRQFNLGMNNGTQFSQYHLMQARDVISNWSGIVHFNRLRMNVIIIGKEESEDLAFLFFNHLNSSGKRLSDYDLLKSHHLRFVADDVAEVMARHWGELDNPSRPDEINILLHNVLYRLRQWLAKEKNFPYQADATENHELFRHFTLDFEPIDGLCTFYKPTQLNSMLSGGLEFFNYVDFYRQKMKLFSNLESVMLLSPLKWLSYGTLYWGIYALAFMFYCKYGEIYLADAIYAIAWQVSRLRNEVQVRRDYIHSHPVFSDVAAWIDQSTHEKEFLGRALADTNEKKEEVSCDGYTAGAKIQYWKELKGVLDNLSKKSAKATERRRKEKVDLIETALSIVSENAPDINS